MKTSANFRKITHPGGSISDRMGRFKFLLFLWMATCLGSFQSCAQESPTHHNGTLIFQSGFEPTSSVVSKGGDADIIGIDHSLPDHNDWVMDLDENPEIGSFSLQYQGGDSTQRYARIVPEPGNPGNHVLKFWLDKPNVEGSKGRIQANLYG
ncbi:MAG: hypothetical protein LWW85_14130, partial [Marinilabiliales bacterium]|nr:hypothetical protein [Marinilabiliales bacterium]